jgi:hypothetical protein
MWSLDNSFMETQVLHLSSFREIQKAKEPCSAGRCEEIESWLVIVVTSM